MHQIDVDFDVWKALTAQLEHEKQTYNDVLRTILELDSLQEPAPEPDSPMGQVASFGEIVSSSFFTSRRGFVSRGLFLPDGTKIRAQYKGNPYYAKIETGVWMDEHGKSHSSPSAAANAVTGNSVNGLRFWEALRPTDTKWRRLDLIA